jgi:hypothetical protein
LFTFSGLVISSGAMWTYAFTAPALAREAPQLLASDSSIIKAVLVFMAAGQIGWLFLLLASWRANILPRWAVLAASMSIFLAVVLTLFAQTQLIRFIYNVLFGAGPALLGYVLWRERPAEA